MKAAYLATVGSPEVIQFGELPKPTPGAGQLLVRVNRAALNPIDTYIRSGLVSMPLPKPFIPGCDFAGVVEAVGEGVSRFRVGERVWGSNQGLLGRQGTCAEYVCPDEAYTYPTPEAVSDDAAAALALTGITAYLGLFFRVNLQAGETVFVHGGTGGVGSLVIQMAKQVGAKVITTVGSPEKAQVASELGADLVLNYKTTDLTKAILEATDGQGVNVYYETQPPTDFDAMVARTAAYGRVVVMAGRAARPEFPNGPFYVKGLALFGFAMFNVPPDTQRQAAEAINTWASAANLKPLIGARFPLAQVRQAHELQESNTLGKVGTLSGKILIDVN